MKELINVPKRKEVLKIRCSDGRSRKPDDIRGNKNFVHEIRQPGGILFPDLCAFANIGGEQTSEMREQAMMFAIDIMVKLKQPEEIILVYHTYCGAAETIGFNECTVRTVHVAWCKKLTLRYPNINVRILKEKHSECGEHHHGHEEVAQTSVAA